MMSDPESDNARLRRFQRERCDRAFGELVARHAPLVLCTARRQLGPWAATWADDVAQQVFVELARRAQGFPPDFGLPGWLYRQTCRRAANVLRGEVRRQQREMVTGSAEIESENWDAQKREHEELQHREQALSTVLEQLPASDASLLVERFIQRRPVSDLAQAAGATEEAVRKRLTRALERARALAKPLHFSTMLWPWSAENPAAITWAIPPGTITAERSAQLATKALDQAPVSSVAGSLVAAAVGAPMISLCSAAAGLLLALPWVLSDPRDGATAMSTPGPAVPTGPRPRVPVAAAPPRSQAMLGFSLTPPATVEEMIVAIRQLGLWPIDSEIARVRWSWLCHHAPHGVEKELIIATAENWPAAAKIRGYTGLDTFILTLASRSPMPTLRALEELAQPEFAHLGTRVLLTTAFSNINQSARGEAWTWLEDKIKSRGALGQCLPGEKASPLVNLLANLWPRHTQSPKAEADLILYGLSTLPEVEVQTALLREVQDRMDIKTLVRSIAALPPAWRPALHDEVVRSVMTNFTVKKPRETLLAAWPEAREHTDPYLWLVGADRKVSKEEVEHLLAQHPGREGEIFGRITEVVLAATGRNSSERQAAADWLAAQPWAQSDEYRAARFSAAKQVSDISVHTLLDIAAIRSPDLRLRAVGAWAQSLRWGGFSSEYITQALAVFEDPAERQALQARIEEILTTLNK